MNEPTPPRRIIKTREQAARAIVDLLGIWRLCTRPHCRRARGCSGPTQRCFQAYFPLLPDAVQLWYETMLDARKEGLSYDDAAERAAEAEVETAIELWHQAIIDADAVMRAAEPAAGTANSARGARAGT